MIFINNGSSYQSLKVIALHDLTNGFISTFSSVYNNSEIVDIDASFGVGVLKVSIVPKAGVSGLTTYRYSKVAI